MIVYGLPVVLEELFLFFCWFRSYISFAQEVFFYMKISWLPVSSVSTDGRTFAVSDGGDINKVLSTLLHYKIMYFWIPCKPCRITILLLFNLFQVVN